MRRESAYPTDVPYPTTYFRELSPPWLSYVAALRGVPAPDPARPFRYLELGSGSGLSAAVHAAANPHATVHACDFDGDAVAAARHHAQRLGAANLTVHQASFTELSALALPQFDYIAAHGVYTWVEETQQRALLEVIRTRLRPGGLAYLSYNCLPGWSAETPLARLSRAIAATLPGDTAERARGAVGAMQLMATAGFRYFETSPAARTALHAYQRADAGYLAHELLNPAWTAVYSLDLQRRLQAAGTHFIGSATLTDNHPALCMADAASRLVAALPHELQELAQDFAVSRQFRRDVFRATGGPAAAAERHDPWIGCLDDPARLEGAVRVPRGELRFAGEFARALATLMADGALPMGELAAALAGRCADPAAVRRNLHFAVAAGSLTPFAGGGPQPGRCRQRACAPGRFRDDIVAGCFEEAAHGERSVWVPSTVVGAGVAVTPAQATRVLRALRADRHAADHALLERFLRLGILECRQG